MCVTSLFNLHCTSWLCVSVCEPLVWMLGRLYLSEGQSAESDYFRVEHYILSTNLHSLLCLLLFIILHSYFMVTTLCLFNQQKFYHLVQNDNHYICAPYVCSRRQFLLLWLATYIKQRADVYILIGNRKHKVRNMSQACTVLGMKQYQFRCVC